jgi:hypothetical protein
MVAKFVTCHALKTHPMIGSDQTPTQKTKSRKPPKTLVNDFISWFLSAEFRLKTVAKKSPTHANNAIHNTAIANRTKGHATEIMVVAVSA